MLDPAVGAGALLLEAARRPGFRGRLLGIDVDGERLEETRQRLQPHTSDLELWKGDALKMAGAVAGRFDVVVANPPYIAWHRIDKAVRTPLEVGAYLGCPLQGRPRHADHQPDLSLFFLLLGFHALKEGGRLAFLIPPEWMTAARAEPLRSYLREQVKLEALIEFPGQTDFFAKAREGDQAHISVMILVASRMKPDGTPPLAVKVASLGTNFAQGASILSAYLRGVAGSVDSLTLETTQAPSWCVTPRLRPSRPGIFDFVPLGDVPGVSVLAGHQPRVAMLRWLELDVEAYSSLPENERRYVYPALKEASDIHHPIVSPPSRWWVFLPGSCLSEEDVNSLAPILYRRMKMRLTSCGGDEEPAWWRFPNPRSLARVKSATERLIAPRVARRLRVSYDVYGHMIKGTNSLIMADSQWCWGLKALLGLLNCSALDAIARKRGLTYHGEWIVQEPRALRLLPIPIPRSDEGRERMRALVRRVDAALQSMEGWDFVDTDSNRIYENAELH